MRPQRDAFRVLLHQEAEAHLLGEAVAELDHRRELVTRIDVHQREGNGTRVECFLGEAQQTTAVFAYGPEHYRVLKLGDHLTHDVDGLGFEGLQVV